jgi:hypothetical protein
MSESLSGEEKYNNEDEENEQDEEIEEIWINEDRLVSDEFVLYKTMVMPDGKIICQFLGTTPDNLVAEEYLEFGATENVIARVHTLDEILSEAIYRRKHHGQKLQ